MANVVIISADEVLVPTSVQNQIREAFAFSKNKEVEVRKGDSIGEFDIYQNGQYKDTITDL